MAKAAQWSDLLSCLVDNARTHSEDVPGVDVAEWLGYVEKDYDGVDLTYIDHETIGGE